MNLSAAALLLMAEKGLTLHDVAEIAAANEQRSDPTNAQRQARHRAKRKEGESNGVTVTRYNGPPNESTLTPPEVSKDEAIASSQAARQPTAEAALIWNENANPTGWPKVQTLSPSRLRALSARLREGGLARWKAAIAKARESPYLGGSDPPHWFTFSWLIKSENFAKLMEGNYDRQRSVSSLGGPRPDPTLALVRAATAAQREDHRDHGEARLALPASKLG